MSPLQSISPQTLVQANPFNSPSKAKNKRGLDENSGDQEVNTKISKMIKTGEEASNLDSSKVSQALKDRARKQKNCNLPNDNRLQKTDKFTQSAISEASNTDPLFDPLFLPNPVVSICGDYSLFSECINLFLSGAPISLNTLANSIIKASNFQINEFVNDLRRRYKSDSPTLQENFNRIVHVFFQYANEKNQYYFFSKLLNEEVGLLSNILSALPRDLTKLNLNKCHALRNMHIEQILEFRLEYLDLDLSPFKDEGIKSLVTSKKLDCLQTLHLSVSTELSDDTFQALVNNPYMIALQNLKLFGGQHKSLTNRALEILIKSSHLPNLKNLDLNWNLLLEDGTIQELINSPLMDRLHSVNLSNCGKISSGMKLRVTKILEENASKRQLLEPPTSA
jgi:hypothetical protein